MNTQEIRNEYLKFFEARGHKITARAPLVLKDDPTTLFTGSGMQPMIPYLLGQPHPDGKRITDSQTCIRAQDIDDVGDNRHTTFFEMLGNWSMGDYFKDQQIEWIAEFLFDVVGLDPRKVYVSCYIGNEKYGIPRDDQAIELWTKIFADRGIDAKVVEIGSAENGDMLGMQGGRIFLYDGKENWWSRNGNEENTPVGDPCGPDSEMFYDFGEAAHDPSFGEPHPASDSGRFMEIGNNVFMAYKKVAEGTFELLDKPNIDHGSGLERIAAAKLDNPDVFRISLMWPIIEKLQKLSKKEYESHTESMRVIADHLRAATFLAVDGCVPSNKEQGYVMRRLLRRAIRFSFDLGIEQNFLQEIVPVIADLYENDFPEVKSNREEIIAVLVKEEKAFRQTLRKGLQQFAKFEKIDGEALFTLYDTYGFPVELSSEEAVKQGVELPANWREQFDARMEEQRNRSRTAGKGEFKGGLGGDSLQHRKYHTATHLLQSALREVIGPVFQQHGSNITEERLRFDFNFDRKVTREELDRAEELVNGWIAEDLPVSFKMYPTQEALDMGAIGPFGERYDAEVKVYQMGEGDNIASLEICGGPHVDHTGQLAEGGKKFKITKEESSSAGIRRIKAILA
jgi:alanyl-tRNA synthetase